MPFEKSFEHRAGRRELCRQQRVGLVQGLSQAVAEVTGEGRKRSRPGATTGGGGGGQQLQESGRDCEKTMEAMRWRCGMERGGGGGWLQDGRGFCTCRQKDSLFPLDWAGQSVSTQAEVGSVGMPSL